MCLRDKLLTPIFSTCTKIFDDVPNVDTRISNLPSRLNDWVIKRTFSIVESLNLCLYFSYIRKKRKKVKRNKIKLNCRYRSEVDMSE